MVFQKCAEMMTCSSGEGVSVDSKSCRVKSLVQELVLI